MTSFHVFRNAKLHRAVEEKTCPPSCYLAGGNSFDRTLVHVPTCSLSMPSLEQLSYDILTTWTNQNQCFFHDTRCFMLTKRAEDLLTMIVITSGHVPTEYYLKKTNNNKFFFSFFYRSMAPFRFLQLFMKLLLCSIDTLAAPHLYIIFYAQAQPAAVYFIFFSLNKRKADYIQGHDKKFAEGNSHFPHKSGCPLLKALLKQMFSSASAAAPPFSWGFFRLRILY